MVNRMQRFHVGVIKRKLNRTRIFNLDESPMPLSLTKQTWANKGQQVVTIVNGKDDYDKRQGTLVCLIPSNGDLVSSINVGLVFRGLGQRIPTLEEQFYKKYCKNVDIFFQPKAWVDQPTMIKIVEKTWKNACTNMEKHPLFRDSPKERNHIFMDNLEAHTTLETKRAFAKLNTDVIFGPPSLTQSWQPVDQGWAAIFKSLYAQKLEDWLDLVDSDTNVPNFDLWESGKMTASDRRMVMALCVQQAYEEIIELIRINDPNRFNAESLRRMFARGGLLVTSDPETWKEVTPQGFEKYAIPCDDLNVFDDETNVDSLENVDEVEQEPDEEFNEDDDDSDGNYSEEDDDEEKEARRFDFNAAINSLPITARNSIKDPATAEPECIPHSIRSN